MKTKTLLALSVLAFSSQGLSACDVSSPGNLTESRVEVHEDKYFEQKPAAEVDVNYLGDLASYYARYGDGPLYATVTYNPRSKSATAMQATQKASEIGAFLRKKGVSDVKVDIMPMREQGADMTVLTSFVTYTAQAPKDCTLMSGFEDLDQELQKDYKLGCTLESVMARQISRPKDLMGGTGLPSERVATGIHTTTAPASFNRPNSGLGGESATE